MTIELTPGLKGGKKQKFIRENRDMILKYRDQFGDEETCRRFNMKLFTLNRIVKEDQVIDAQIYNDARKALDRCSVVETGLSETRAEVRLLERKYDKFTEIVADKLTNNFFIPLLRGKIDLPPGLEPKPDPLSIANFDQLAIYKRHKTKE